MKIGIVGLPQTGKKTLFSLLVGHGAPEAHADARAAVRGVADVLDPRLDGLVVLYRPKRQTRARLEVTLFPGIDEKTLSQGEAHKEFSEVEAFCHVVRVFEDEKVYHVWSRPDPGREVEFLHHEFVLHDLVFIEKRLERINKGLKKGKDERADKERALLVRLRDTLEKDVPLRRVELSHDEAALIASYPFLSRPPLIVALNVADDQVADTRVRDELARRFERLGADFVQIAARAEAEIARLDSAEERQAFMQSMGITESALHLLTSHCIEALGLVSFFTVSHNEVRQWFVHRGSLAPEAAGVIHSDMQRGFIRAEVMKYDELVAAGSEEKLKAAGKYLVKGRDYAVADGDILFIRFNV
jgi:hypothetical protein